MRGGLEADRAACAAHLARSLSVVTALVPRLGYDAAGEIAKLAESTGQTVRQIVSTRGLLDEDELDRLLSAAAMTTPWPPLRAVSLTTT